VHKFRQHYQDSRLQAHRMPRPPEPYRGLLVLHQLQALLRLALLRPLEASLRLAQVLFFQAPQAAERRDGGKEEEKGGEKGRNELEAPVLDVQVSLPHALSLAHPPSIPPSLPPSFPPSVPLFQPPSFPPSFARPLIPSDANVHVELRGVLIQLPHQMEGPLDVVRQRLKPLQEVLCKSEEGK
jgi:hypothetical protein